MTYLNRVGVLSGISDVLDEFGHDLTAVLEDCGLRADILDNVDNLIDLDAAANLLDRGAALCDCPHFGLLVAKATGQSMNSMGMLGLIMQSAPDALTALRKGFLYYNQQKYGVHLDLEIEGDYATIKYSYERDIETVSQQGISMVVARVCTAFRLMIGDKWRPREVCFQYTKPAGSWFYRQLFGCAVSFNAEFNGFVFSAVSLRQPLSTQNDYLHYTMNQHVAALSSGVTVVLSEQLNG